MLLEMTNQRLVHKVALLETSPTSFRIRYRQPKSEIVTLHSEIV